MSEPPPIHMRGEGYYSLHTQGAKRVLDTLVPLAVAALDSMDLSAGAAPFVIADFGAADGGTSIDLQRAVIERLRERTEREIVLTYTDLPHNDFSSLFKRLHGIAPMSDAPPIATMPRVFTFASATSFHRQVLPDASLSLGISATAMHWLSRLPATLDDHVHSVGAQGDALTAFRDQAAADWEAILLARAAELAPGGRLVLANFCKDEQGRYLGWTGGQNMHMNFATHWRALREAGVINAGEQRRATFPQHYRSVAEFRAPFDDPHSTVSRAGLGLETIFTRVTPCPYAERFRDGQPAAEFARAYIPTLRSWSESMFAGALDATRPERERRDIIDLFYRAYERDVATAPEGHAMDYVHCFMVIGKGN